MPALTTVQLRNLLGEYTEPGGDFLASLNQVLARIYSTGTYRDLTVQYSLPVVDSHVTLPDDADAILHVMVDGYPVPARSLWHDYRSVGSSYDSGDISWGLIDAGYWPTAISHERLDRLFVVPSSSDFRNSDWDPENDGSSITVVGVDLSANFTFQSNTPNYPGDPYRTLEFNNGIDSIDQILSIRFDGLPAAFDLRTNAADPATTVATVGPNSGVTRYRRFRINRATDGQTVVHVLCKRAFKPLESDDDICYIANVGALKHGMLGRIAEDNADLERAEYHWQRCTKLLDEEAASAMGSATPRLMLDPFGTNGRNNMMNFL